MKLIGQRVEAVLFDLGGTLIKTSEIPLVMKKLLKRRGIERSLTEISAAKKRAESGLNFRDLATLLDEFWIRWNLRILENLNVKSQARELAEFITTHWWSYSRVSLFADAKKVLPLLRARGLKIGVITNGLSSDVNEILPKVNLQNFFDIIVVIDTLKKMKPDPDVFLYALEKLKTTAANTIFVGDELEADYEGARRTGLTAYLIDRDDKIQDENVNRISSLDDLFRLKIID